MAFLALIFFARTDGRNVIPLPPDLILDVSNWERSVNLDGLVMANRKTVFNVTAFNGRDSDCPRHSKWFRTLCTSQVLEYLGMGGLTLNKPLINLVVMGCWPTGTPSTFSCTDEMADL